MKYSSILSLSLINHNVSQFFFLSSAFVVPIRSACSLHFVNSVPYSSEPSHDSLPHLYFEDTNPVKA
uniref:Uncharacterized protein n=1 Tax=Arundo donax TaxID=35708 RepID=A0A0A9G3Z7_ARUDO